MSEDQGIVEQKIGFIVMDGELQDAIQATAIACEGADRAARHYQLLVEQLQYLLAIQAARMNMLRLAPSGSTSPASPPPPPPPSDYRCGKVAGPR